MSTLNVSVIALVAVVVAMVMLFNFWQSRVNRRAAERLFRQQSGIIEERAGIARRRQESFERGMEPEHGLDGGELDALYADDAFEPRLDPDDGPGWSPAPAKSAPSPLPRAREASHAPMPQSMPQSMPPQMTQPVAQPVAQPVPRSTPQPVPESVPQGAGRHPPALDRFADDLRRITERMPRVLPESEGAGSPRGAQAMPTRRTQVPEDDREAPAPHAQLAPAWTPASRDGETGHAAASPAYTLVDTPGGMTVGRDRDAAESPPSAHTRRPPAPPMHGTDAGARPHAAPSPGDTASPSAPSTAAASTQTTAPTPTTRQAPGVIGVTVPDGAADRGRTSDGAVPGSAAPAGAADGLADPAVATGDERTAQPAEHEHPRDAFLHAVLLPPSPVNTDRLIALMSSLRHVGSKPVRIEVDGGDGRFAPLVAGGLAARIRCAALLANRQGPLNAVELSDFVAALVGFAEQLGARFEQPDMGEVLMRARRLDSLAADLDTQVELTVEAPGPVGASQLATIGKSLGLYERGGGRFACLTEEGQTLYTMSATPGADQILFVLDVPRVDRAADPWPAMVRCAGDCARLVGGRLVDSQARGLSVGMIEAVGRQLDERFAQLEAAGLKAGSDVSLLIFN
ncbi:MAG: hypothetical protein AB7P21_08270 [Lautropia sp.]